MPPKTGLVLELQDLIISKHQAASQARRSCLLRCTNFLWSFSCAGQERSTAKPSHLKDKLVHTPILGRDVFLIFGLSSVAK